MTSLVVTGMDHMEALDKFGLILTSFVTYFSLYDVPFWEPHHKGQNATKNKQCICWNVSDIQWYLVVSTKIIGFVEWGLCPIVEA